MSLYDINKALETPPPPNPAQLNAIVSPPDSKLPKSPEDTLLESLVPPEYHSFLPLFQKSTANQLPPHRPYDHRIPLKEGFEPPFGLLYSLSRHELEASKLWIDENLDKGFIRTSSLPAGVPILFVKKGTGHCD